MKKEFNYFLTVDISSTDIGFALQNNHTDEIVSTHIVLDKKLSEQEKIWHLASELENFFETGCDLGDKIYIL